ncbi:hypothetical protein M8J76_003185 [Diaphorina citri]|nr:hypothetical protein M8J76_012637 [Diaphorina citri]KAI5713664.1 hypothetical protein M8J76_003185 [Diaphorina citri]
MLEQSNTIILVLIQHEATTYHYKAYKINETRLVLRTMGRFTTRTESKPFVKIEQIFIPKRRKEEKNKVISSTFSTAELEKLSPNQDLQGAGVETSGSPGDPGGYYQTLNASTANILQRISATFANSGDITPNNDVSPTV